jgi:hypothetical protein
MGGAVLSARIAVGVVNEVIEFMQSPHPIEYLMYYSN